MCNYCSLVAGETLRQNGMTDRGAPVILTYTFPDGADLPADQDPASAMLVEATRRAMDYLETVAGVLTVEVDRDARAMVEIGMNADPTDRVSYATLPDVTAFSPHSVSELAMSATFNNFDAGSIGYEILLHEIGHVLGFKHPHEGQDKLNPFLDNTNHTLMSYNNRGAPKSEYQEIDLEALEEFYGDPQALWGVSAEFDTASSVLEVRGSRKDNVLIAVNDRSIIRGWDGDDTIIGRSAHDTLVGGNGDDSLDGLKGHDRIFGGAGNDVLEGGLGRDRLDGGNGNDTLFGQGHADVLIGGSGDDLLLGQGGNDTLRGGAGNDIVNGARGDDSLSGGDGNDIVKGGTGNDTLAGGRGSDALYGGPGADVFVATRNDYDAIVDFEVGLDSLDVSVFDLTAAEARDRIADWNGSLWFDTGDSGVKLAGLSGTPASDIDVIV